MHLLSIITLIILSPCHHIVKNVYIYALHHIIHIIPCAFYIFIYVLMHIGSIEGVTLLEFELEGEETQQEIPQEEVLEGEGQDQEELPKCPDHRPSAYLKGKPRSILSLP